MVKEAKAPMTLVWLKVLHPFILAYIVLRKYSDFNNLVLCTVKNKQPHYTIISLSLSVVCFHTSFLPMLTLPRTVLMLCFTKPSFTVNFFTERICYFTIWDLIAIIAITLDSCLCWLRTTLETRDTFCQVLAVLHTEKHEIMVFSVTQGAPKELPQILSLLFPEGFTDASLSKSASQQIMSQ